MPSPTNNEYKYLNDITIYTKTNCGYCKRSKKYLTKHGFSYEKLI